MANTEKNIVLKSEAILCILMTILNCDVAIAGWIVCFC